MKGHHPEATGLASSTECGSKGMAGPLQAESLNCYPSSTNFVCNDPCKLLTSAHMVQPDFKLRLFDILVEPVLSYGCQVWGPEIFAGKLRNPLNLPSEKVHTNYLRIMAGVGSGADKVMLMREFGRYPVMWHWVALATRFWIRAIKMGSHKLVCKALRADIELMLAGCKKCWSYYLLQSLTIVGVVQASDWSPSGTSHVTVDSIMALDIFVCLFVKRKLCVRV